MTMVTDEWSPELPQVSFRPTNKQLDRWKTVSQRRGEFQTKNLLQDIMNRWRCLRTEGPDPPQGWLLSFRDRLRRTFSDCDTASIHLFMARCPAELRPIGAWMLGKCANRFLHHELRYYCGDSSRKVRRQVAKAFRRLEAWHLLDAMAGDFPGDESIAWCHQRSFRRSAPFAERLRQFSRHVDQSHAADSVGPPRMAYWSRFTPWQGQPPKSIAYIRWMLWRIHRWVHGG